MSKMAAEAARAAQRAKQEGQRLVANPKFGWLARLGFAARGVVYLLVGGLAALAALGYGGQTTDFRGAMDSLVNEPLGRTMLLAVGIGFLALAISRALQAIVGTNLRGPYLWQVLVRISYGISAVINGFLATFAADLVLGWSSGRNRYSGNRGMQSWSAWALHQPAGQLLLIAIGAGIAGFGIAQIVMGWIGTYRKWLAMAPKKMKWADPIYKFGLIAHGIVLLLIGAFLVLAAFEANPGEARGFGGALRALLGEPYLGVILLLIVASGLIAFGFSSIIQAIYGRRVGSDN